MNETVILALITAVTSTGVLKLAERWVATRTGHDSVDRRELLKFREELRQRLLAADQRATAQDQRLNDQSRLLEECKEARSQALVTIAALTERNLAQAETIRVQRERLDELDRRLRALEQINHLMDSEIERVRRRTEDEETP